ncbi:hypothetical protein K431DRAFT_268175 [Polychaeton citri CBS 116435]|uniref:SEC7 domain-containing protein n=1 Tax=Polychaeton citri CBS 116435 TaxID=1314669 RepID=A0A9P4QB72_9PEZI|nr:hypothetical protein K431DRAFT_268175 [Polychaeton citri CBS 116435]
MLLLSRRRSALDFLSQQPQPDSQPDTAEDPSRLRPRTSSALEPSPASPTRPRSEYAFPLSRLSHEVLQHEIPDHPRNTAGADGGRRQKRFSMLRLRNHSESQLSVVGRRDSSGLYNSDEVPPVPSLTTPPAAPAIIRTAPTMADLDAHEQQQEQQQPQPRQRRPLFKRSPSKRSAKSVQGRGQGQGQGQEPRKSAEVAREGAVDKRRNPPSIRWRRMQGRSTGLDDLARLSSQRSSLNAQTPPASADPTTVASDLLALPTPRASESSQSGDSADQVPGAAKTSTSHSSNFFKLPRRNKNRNSLFPLPIKIPHPEAPEEQQQQQQQRQQQQSPHRLGSPTSPSTPRASTSAVSARSLQTPDSNRTPHVLFRRHTETSPIKREQSHSPFRSPRAALARGSLFGIEPGMGLNRGNSQRSQASSASSPLQPPVRLSARDRASTTSSYGRISHDIESPPPWNGSQRTSTSTTGRSSLGGFLNLARFRQQSDPHSPRRGSPGTGSKSNSFALSREALVVPEREEGEAPGKYLERLEAAVSRSMIATVLSKSADAFAQAVLRSHCRRFPFFGEPIDMSLRKFLLEAELPKETQQIDRVVQAFADRYHECNPGIFQSPEQAYIIAFSLLMLHTDAFNKNNKHKMTKSDYCRNASGQGVHEDVLACFYDNICYTPFIHFEEEVDFGGEKGQQLIQQKKRKLKEAISDSGKKPSGPIDPYTLLVEQKLDTIRPSIKDSITMDDHYSYLGSQSGLDASYLQRAFTHTGTLQIISARSRPTAYSEGQMAMNGGMMVPNSSVLADTQGQAGVIDIKVTKVGTLWRKATKRKKARSPWQEWGAILTGSQLYMFKNVHWVKGLMHQFLQKQKHGHPRTPVTFQPPLHDFKPDELLKIDDAVALTDGTYTRHKHAFIFVRPGGQEEVFLADNEGEMNDWLGLLNYAAAFRAAGIRVRGMVGGAEDTKPVELARISTASSAQPHHISESEVALATQHRGFTPQLHQQVMAARKQLMIRKINEADDKLSANRRHLDDILRNARHLQILAPIAPRTRDDVVFSARKHDAQIRWSRRDIWRITCHKDILAMDIQQDGHPTPVAATEPEAHPLEFAESGKKAKSKGLLRLHSKHSEPSSNPQSPKSPTSASPSTSPPGRPSLVLRPSTNGSDATFMGDDVFRTPPESATNPKAGEPWHLPPLQFDTDSRFVSSIDQTHRGSIASTMLSAASHSQRQRASLSNESPASSVQPTPSGLEANLDPFASQATPRASIDDSELERLAKGSVTPEPVPLASHGLGIDGTPADAMVKTPDNKHRSGVRRSLQKTLRDAHPGSKHRRNKESESTVRSNPDPAGLDLDSTPGLERAKGRFILHGKQASVIQFGPEWPTDRMRSRREPNRTASGESAQIGLHRKTTDEQSQFSLDPSRLPASSKSNRDAASLSGGSRATSRTHSFREDASVADAYATTASPAAISSSAGDDSDVPSGYDLSSFEPPPFLNNDQYQTYGSHRDTVIGPKRLQSAEFLAKGEDSNGVGMVVVDDRNVDEGSNGNNDRDHRRTVVGPSPAIRLNGTKAYQDDSDEDSEGQHFSEATSGVTSLEDDELRRLSTPSSSHAVTVN